MTDPKITLLELLKGEWELSTEPGFLADWPDEKVDYPVVTVTHLATRVTPLGFSDDVPKADRRITGSYFVDVWSRGDSDERYKLLKEADRILKSRISEPPGDLEEVWVSGWVDLDEQQLRPPIYRSQLQVGVVYYG